MPQNVETISRLAQDYEYNPSIPLRYWLRTAATLEREAHIYLREGNDEQTYLLLFRHAQLVLVHLVNHPEAKDEKNQRSMKEVEGQEVMSKSRAPFPPATNRASPPDLALTNVAEPLEAGENRDLAVQLARTEISRRATMRQAIQQVSKGNWETDQDLSRRIQDVRVTLAENSDQRVQGPSVRPTTTASSTSTYKYPTVPRQRPRDVTSQPLPPSPPLPPLPPPKERVATNGIDVGDEPSPPPRPDKVSAAEVPAVPDKTPNESELRPSSFTFKPSAYLENGTPLRTVFLPPELRTVFLDLAAPNTRRNLETCGILCGTLISNALFVSRLLIPEQTATSDTCETVNESAIFEYCDAEELMMLGWIHTHPTQTCFMSSRDLHTHCGYQVMLPESIAIVCAPSKMPDWGVFRLTDPPGLKTVLNCTQSGLFHPHPETHIYTDALRPGHVVEAKGLEFETVDLR
ncbi:putative endosome-associated ubiquitin isopeptidase (AmsH) [Aspergillus tanneri]|uniref:MPN domain-containing protein n=1 Tax=Aspergillus tanneri TaxID=1220188 RepID=A0A5M9MJC5_9EURO|nr:uncharacterized protein ATNIH1004_007397 [Aspergillus tanneri]KAA8645976.1 hypothetical protein ATNIH1004_007397 [Aspergillus tanneri]